MRIGASTIAFLIMLSLCACGGGSNAGSPPATGEPESPIDMDVPVQPDEPEPPRFDEPPDPSLIGIWQAQFLAGPEGNFCGSASIDAFFGPTNLCIDSAFQIYEPFYAMRYRGGVDSIFGTGVAYNGMELYIFNFDTLSSSQSFSGYRVRECVEPRFDEANVNSRLAPFLCDELVEIEPDLPE